MLLHVAQALDKALEQKWQAEEVMKALDAARRGLQIFLSLALSAMLGR